MAILKCKRCGGYNSPSEWPDEERANFVPDLCYNCSRNHSVEDDAAEEEPVEVDNDPEGLIAQDEAEKESSGEEVEDD